MIITLVESVFGDTCSFDAPSDISVVCGPGSDLVSADLDSNPACARITPQYIECSFDANVIADDFDSVEVSCRGSTQEALSLSLDWDPKSMRCTSSSFGTELAGLGYGVLMWQTCDPFRNFAIKMPLHSSVLLLHLLCTRTSPRYAQLHVSIAM